MKNVAISIRRVRELILAIRDSRLQLQPPFQRNLVWTSKDQLYFLDTVLNGFPFPEIYVAAGPVNTDSAEGTDLVVDGQQRVTTLYHYFTGHDSLKLPRTFPKYEDLDNSQKIAFLEYRVVVRDLGSMETDDIVQVFERINATQYSLNKTEIQHARYTGHMRNLAERVSDHQFFQDYKVFSPAQLRRMQDIEFMLSFIITIMSTYFNRDTEIERYLERYNDDFDEMTSVENEAITIVNFVQGCKFNQSSRVKNRSDLFTLLVELHRFMFRDGNLDLNVEIIKPRVENFFLEVDNHAENIEHKYSSAVLEQYYAAAIQGTNDRGSRIIRGRIMSQVLRGDDPATVSAVDGSKEEEPGVEEQ